MQGQEFHPHISFNNASCLNFNKDISELHEKLNFYYHNGKIQNQCKEYLSLENSKFIYILKFVQ